MINCFTATDILLPDFKQVSGEKWATVACDQFTSQKEYWENVKSIVGDSPSTLNIMLPEAYLDREKELLPGIFGHMEEYCKNVFKEYKNTYIYVERTQSDGKIRKGLVGAVDLEYYDWHDGIHTFVRATEKTVPERIPPRVNIRRRACIELPHIMLLIDDKKKQVIESLSEYKDKMRKAYDFSLMLGGGHITGYFVNGDMAVYVRDKLCEFFGSQPEMKIAAGDGNHSLATAKTVYEELKEEIGPEKAMKHPARYAMAELVNIHDDALEFEPIYRIMTDVTPAKVQQDFEKYTDTLDGEADPQEIRLVYGDKSVVFNIPHPVNHLAVGTVQRFIDLYVSGNRQCKVDYIHGVSNVLKLVSDPRSVGFIFRGMDKSELFPTVMCDCSLPRKTFSMGHAEDKRYYIEARKIL